MHFVTVRRKTYLEQISPFTARYVGCYMLHPKPFQVCVGLVSLHFAPLRLTVPDRLGLIGGAFLVIGGGAVEEGLNLHVSSGVIIEVSHASTVQQPEVQMPCKRCHRAVLWAVTIVSIDGECHVRWEESISELVRLCHWNDVNANVPLLRVLAV
jgi:hypothetical protein